MEIASGRDKLKKYSHQLTVCHFGLYGENALDFKSMYSQIVKKNRFSTGNQLNKYPDMSQYRKVYN